MNLNISSQAFIATAENIRGEDRNRPLQVNIGSDGLHSITVSSAFQADYETTRATVSHFRNALAATYGAHITNFSLRDPGNDHLIQNSLTAHAIAQVSSTAEVLYDRAEQIKQNIVQFNNLRTRAYEGGLLSKKPQIIETEDIGSNIEILFRRALDFSEAELTFTAELNNKIQNWVRISDGTSHYDRSSFALTLLKDTIDVSSRILRCSFIISVQAHAYYALAGGGTPLERELATTIGENHNIAVRHRAVATGSFGSFGANRPLRSLEEEDGVSTPSTRSNSDEEKDGSNKKDDSK